MSTAQLIDDAVIFPYGSAIVIPTILWRISLANERNQKVINQVKETLKNFGIDMNDLLVDTSRFWDQAYDAYLLGTVYERLLVSSFMGRWILATNYGKDRQRVSLRELYSLAEESSQFGNLPDIPLCFASGILRGKQEHKVWRGVFFFMM